MKSTRHIRIGAVLFVAFFALTWALSNKGLQAQTPDIVSTQEQTDVLKKIEPLVLTQIETSKQTEFFIWMTEKADLSPAYDLETKEEKGQFVFETLRETAARSQADLRNQFDRSGIEYRSYYIANKILVYGGTQTLLMDIASRADVSQITANHTYQLQEPTKSPARTAPLAIETNLTFINADDVWGLGYTGNGIVLAGNDTGLDETHPTILPHYRGCQNPPTCSTIDHNYNWWDATSTYPLDPDDGHGHGTHTTGTMVGDDGGANQIGVAPGAQTIHCKNMTDSGSGSDLTFSTCFEWDLAPWDLNGANPRPDLAPDAINNSWGYSGGGQTQFRDEIAALQAAGILVELSAGNSGPSCSTLGSPGDYQEVLTTGSINHASGSMPGTITDFSSRGPSSLDGDYFPDIMAPGENIRSALPGNSYGSWNGTSMSGPHVTALVGLMWSAGPALRGDIDATVDIIRNTAVPLTGQNGSSCGGDYTTGPNNDWGFGTIDALAAVQEAMLYGAVGTLNGMVTDSSNNNPIEGALIDATLSPTQTWGTATNATGVYTTTLITGTYDVEASAFGYLPVSVSNIDIISGTTTIQDFVLTPAPNYTVDGYVTDANTGWPLYANLDIDGYPGDSIWTDPVSGYYSISLPAGITYTFNVNAWASGYMAINSDIGPLTANTTESFALAVDESTCTAPGYTYSLPTPLFSDNFESGYSNWTMSGLWNAENETDTCGVLRAPFPSSSNNAYYGVDDVCTYNNGAANSGELSMSSPVALPPGKITLSFWSYENTENISSFDTRFVEISTDGGGTWTQLSQFLTEDSWYQPTVDMSAYANSNAQIRFQFDTGDSISNDYFGWMIDDVEISSQSCVPPADGGLLIGHTYDENTSSALNGAEVASDGGEVSTTVATPTDVNLDDGFFTIFSPSGNHTFTATMSGGYGADVETLSIANSDTVSQSFNLPAAVIAATPDNLQMTLDMGESVNTTLMLNNSGDLVADFEIRERSGSFIPIPNLTAYTAPSVTTNPSHGSSYSSGDYQLQLPADSKNSYTQAPKRYASPNALMYYGDRLTFDADNPDLALENFGNTLVPAGAITGCPGPFNSTTNDSCFAPGDILDGISLASDPLGAMIVIGIGALGNPDVLVGPDSFSSDHDITFPDEDIYVVGFDLWSPNGDATVDIYIYGLGDVLLDQTSIVATSTGTFWGVASSDLITRIHTTAPGGDGELFTNIAFGAGVSDIPWFAEDPITGTIASLSNVNIDVTFDAGVPEITQPGDYLASLNVRNNSPYGNPTIPITMTVLAPASFGKLEGTITGLGYCDENPTALEDAAVIIETSVGVSTTLSTDAAGYYSFWIDETSGPVTVSVTALEHETGIVTDVEITGQVTTTVDIDLRWLQPCMGATPNALEVTLLQGASMTVDLDIDNTGALSTTFALSEKTGGFTPTRLLGQSYPHMSVPYWDNSETAPDGSLNELLTWGTGSDIPTGERYRAAGTTCDGQSYYVMGGSSGTILNEAWNYNPVSDTWTQLADLPVALMNFEAACLNGFIYLVGGYDGSAHTNNFQIYDIAKDSWTATTWVNASSPMTAVYNGLLYTFGGNPGPSAETWVYDPDAVTWTQLANMPTANSYGTATTVGDYIYQIGGGLANTVQRYDPTNNTWDNSGAQLQDSRMSALSVWYGDYIYVVSGGGAGGDFWSAWSTTEVYDPSLWPSGSWSYDDENVGTPVVAPAGDCASDSIWGAGGTSSGINYATNQFFDNGMTCNVNNSRNDIPWLSEDPITGTINADSLITIDVTFDTMTYTLGTYTGTLKVKSDAPVDGTINIPVTMHVVDYGIELAPATAVRTDTPGTTVAYTLLVTNTGSTADTIDLVPSGNSWTTALSLPNVTLASGASKTVTVTVDIPVGADAGETDTVTITATSQGDGTKSATAVLATTAAAVYGLDLTPATAVRTDTPGTTVAYTLLVTNIGNTADTIDLVPSGNSWTTAVSLPNVTLASGASKTVTVTVAIPVGANAADTDAVTITATSQGDGTKSATAILTSTVEFKYLYLPTIMKP